MPTNEHIPNGLLSKLQQYSRSADGESRWPEQSWLVLRQSGVLAWCIPTEYGGTGLSQSELLAGYHDLASACLTTCFILSQREAACRRIRDHGSPELCRELLPSLASGDTFATVGLSHLTTSRQHTAPAMRATISGPRLILDGSMPWVTGAERANHFITGATLDDGNQIMLVLPRETNGIAIGPPLDLMALAGSMTAEVFCRRVEVDRRYLLAGPAERVMTIGKGGNTGGLETSALAIGLVRSAIDFLGQGSASRPELAPMTERLTQSWTALRNQLLSLSEHGGTAEIAMELRARANAFVLRATQAALTASKGTGFLTSHPAQRWARQAMFFLVWSCPRPAAEATLEYLMPTGGEECG